MTSEDQNLIIPKPERLGVSTTEEGLMQVEIQLRKFKLTVQENDYESRYRLGLLLADVFDQFELKPSENGNEPEPLSEADSIKQNLLIGVWAPLYACSSGEVPTSEQFLKMPEGDIDFWVETGRSLGMQFPWLDEIGKIFSGVVEKQDTKEAKKKGAKSRQKSSPS